jgi:hypothetical protein
MAEFAANTKVNSNLGPSEGVPGTASSLSDQLIGNGGYTSRSRCEKTSLSRYLESRGAAVTSIGSSKDSVIGLKSQENNPHEVSFLKFF